MQVARLTPDMPDRSALLKRAAKSWESCKAKMASEDPGYQKLEDRIREGGP